MKYDFEQRIDRTNTGSFKWDGMDMFFGTNDLLPMWIADMDFPTPAPVVEALKKRIEHPCYGYTLRMESYYLSLMNWLSRRHGWTIEKNWICNSPGIIPALAISVITFTQPGDSVILQAPVYHPFYDAITCNERKLVVNELQFNGSEYQMDFADFEIKVRENNVKLFFLCNPHNPVGRVWTYDELFTLGNICKKYGVQVISDEIHSDLIYSGHKHIIFSQIADFSNFTISCYAPSKTFNLAGLLTSAIVIPNSDLRNVFSGKLWNLGLYLGNIFGVTAFEAAYNECEDWLEQLKDYLTGNIDYMKDFIEKKIPQLKFHKPQSTYLAWLDCRELGLDNENLKQLVIHQAKLGLEMGTDFGPGGSGYMRLNFACPRGLLREGLERLETAVNSLRS